METIYGNEKAESIQKEELINICNRCKLVSDIKLDRCPSCKSTVNVVQKYNLFQCLSCLKNFSNKGNLKRHMDNSTLCQDWIDNYHTRKEYYPSVENFTNIITGTVLQQMLIPTGLSCGVCFRAFSTIGCVTRHYKSSIVCDRIRAYNIIEKSHRTEDNEKWGMKNTETAYLDISNKYLNLTYDFESAIH